MAINDVYHKATDALADGGDFILDGSGSAIGAAEVGELGGSGAADIYRESDPNTDGTFEVSVLIDQVSGNWHSQINGLVVSQGSNLRIRVNNTSGGTADFYATGIEVDD